MRNAECKMQSEEWGGEASGRRNAECKMQGKSGAGEAGQGLVTSRGLGVALGVSLRTVQRMLHDEEIEPVRLGGRSVRFCVPDVVKQLKKRGRKWGRRAALQGTQRTEGRQGA